MTLLIALAIELARMIGRGIHRLILAAVVVFLTIAALSMKGTVIAAYVWAWPDILRVIGMFVVLLVVGFYAGRESNRFEVTYWRGRAYKLHADWREMVEKNKTMIDDVLAAEKAGIQTRTFFHGHTPHEHRPHHNHTHVTRDRTTPPDVDRSPEFRL